MDATARHLDEEQDVEPLEEHGVNGEEVALHDACRVPAQKLRPARLKPPRRRLDPRAAQDRPDSAGRQRDTKPDQLALDTPVPPARILLRQPQHQLAHFHPRRRTTGTAVRIRPATRDQLTMPAQKRRRRHHERRPSGARQHAAKCGEQSSISRPKLRAGDLTLQHL
jgi:hypothetical protein